MIDRARLRHTRRHVEILRAIVEGIHSGVDSIETSDLSRWDYVLYNGEEFVATTMGKNVLRTWEAYMGEYDA